MFLCPCVKIQIRGQARRVHYSLSCSSDSATIWKPVSLLDIYKM